MDLITLNLRGALSAALRDLYKTQGMEINIDQVGSLVDTELWPRMALWLGLNPNFAPNIAQIKYSELDFMNYLTSEDIRYNPWQFRNGEYLFVPQQEQPAEPETPQVPVEPAFNTYRGKDSVGADYIIQIPSNLEKWMGDAKRHIDQKRDEQKTKEEDKWMP